MKLKERYVLLIAISIIAFVILTGLFLYYLKQAKRFREADAKFIEYHKNEIVLSMKLYYFGFDRLPVNLKEFGTHYPRGSETVSKMIEFKHNTSKGDNPLEDFQREMFTKALEKSKKQLQEWHKGVIIARKPLYDLEGDIQAQLELFLNPDFNSSAAIPYLEGLKDKYNVDEKVLIEFCDQNMKMRYAYMGIHAPERIINHPLFIPATEVFAKEEYEEAISKIKEIIPIIIKQIGPEKVYKLREEIKMIPYDKSEFHILVKKADRIVIRQGDFFIGPGKMGIKDKTIFEIKDKKEIQELYNNIKLKEPKTNPCSRCFNWICIDWYIGENRIAVSMLNHSNSFCWREPKQERGKGYRLLFQSIEWFAKWFKGHKIEYAF